jgi:membrane protease YdiL (CAAX protease family)
MRRDGLWVYFILTFVISWLAWGAMVVFGIPGGSVSPDHPAPPPGALALLALGGFGPSIAGVLMTWRHGGRAGVRALWKRCVSFRLGGPAYLVIFIVPLVIAASRIATQLLRGGALSMPTPLARPALLIGLSVQLFLFGPLSEELGWRGFAMDRLLARWGGLRSSLILGALHGLWHLPVFFVPGTIQQLWGDPVFSFGSFWFGTIGMGVVFTWLHLASRGSVWAAILYHLASNYAASLVWMSFDGGPVDRLVTGLAVVGAAAVLIWAGRSVFFRPVPEAGDAGGIAGTLPSPPDSRPARLTP